jgi:hypothetical protein
MTCAAAAGSGPVRGGVTPSWRRAPFRLPPRFLKTQTATNKKSAAKTLYMKVREEPSFLVRVLFQVFLGCVSELFCRQI